MAAMNMDAWHRGHGAQGVYDLDTICFYARHAYPLLELAESRTRTACVWLNMLCLLFPLGTEILE